MTVIGPRSDPGGLGQRRISDVRYTFYRRSHVRKRCVSRVAQTAGVGRPPPGLSVFRAVASRRWANLTKEGPAPATRPLCRDGLRTKGFRPPAVHFAELAVGGGPPLAPANRPSRRPQAAVNGSALAIFAEPCAAVP
jgi:hypothetical protein